MATITTNTAIGERETLADVIVRISPDECPVYSAAQKTTATGVFQEFLVQELASAASNNHVAEGADMTDTGITNVVRMGNYSQISTKGFIISNTLDVVDKAGRDREVAYQRTLKGLELRRDVEKYLTDTNTARDGSSSTRKTASLITWITNGDAPSDMAFATGDGTDQADLTGTARALTLAQIDATHQACWSDGGDPSLLVASATNRANISDLTQSGTNLVTNQVNQTAGKQPSFVGATAILLNDFGQLEIIPSRLMSNDKIFLIDPNHVAISTITGRNFVTQEIAPTGDASKEQVLIEFALIPDAPKAHGAVIGLNGS